MPEKRQKTGNSRAELLEAIDGYTEDADLRKAFCGFVGMRERIRKPLTGYGLRLLFDELGKLAGPDEGLQAAILEQSILKSWQGVFPLGQPARASPLPSNPAPGRTFSELEDDRLARMLADAERRDAMRAGEI